MPRQTVFAPATLRLTQPIDWPEVQRFRRWVSSVDQSVSQDAALVRNRRFDDVTRDPDIAPSCPRGWNRREAWTKKFRRQWCELFREVLRRQASDFKAFSACLSLPPERMWCREDNSWPNPPTYCSTNPSCNAAASALVAAGPTGATCVPAALCCRRHEQSSPPAWFPGKLRPKPSLYWTHSFPG